MTPDESREQILSDFGEIPLRDLAVIIGRSYPQAHRSASQQFSRNIARDVYPYLRRASIEETLSSFNLRHPGIHVMASSNKCDNTHFHRLSAGRTVLTVSKSNAPRTLPQDTDYRQTLAREPQRALPLFQVDDDAPAEEGNAVYGVVVHGPDPEHSDSVAFIEVLIPDRNGRIVLAHIDLFRFWDEDMRPSEFPSVPIVPQAPTLKVVPKRTADESSG